MQIGRNGNSLSVTAHERCSTFAMYADPAVPSGIGGGRTCAGPDWTIMFTNVSAYMMFIEESLGKPCTRKQVDGLDVAQCW